MKIDYKYEMHCHTGEFGWCAKVPTEIILRDHAAAGYQGICITNHYINFVFERMPMRAWQDKIDQYLSSYRKALRLAKAYDLDVILGMEIRFSNDIYNDFLVYGIDDEFLYDHPRLYELSPAEFKTLAEQNGLLIFQAHPYRAFCRPVPAAEVDGYEILNANVRSENHNELAEALQKASGTLATAGSDYHQLQDLGRSGLIFHERIKDSKALVELFRRQKQSPTTLYEIIRPESHQ